MKYYRKYMMSSLALLDQIKVETTSPVSNQPIVTFTETVQVIGPVCESWTTTPSELGHDIPVCETWSDKIAVDILWSQEPLASFESSEVWPVPNSELHTFGNAQALYKRDYCQKFECPPETPIHPVVD